MKDKGIIYDRCKAFSRDIVSLCRSLNQSGEFIISKQILRSATSIGANYSESLGAESPNDFIHKLSISIKEAYETQYWLDILKDCGYIESDCHEILYKKSEEIFKMITASIMTTKKKLDLERQPLNN